MSIPLTLLTLPQARALDKLQNFIAQDKELLEFFTTTGSGKSVMLRALEQSFDSFPKHQSTIENPYLDNDYRTTQRS